MSANPRYSGPLYINILEEQVHDCGTKGVNSLTASWSFKLDNMIKDDQ